MAIGCMVLVRVIAIQYRQIGIAVIFRDPYGFLRCDFELHLHADEIYIRDRDHATCRNDQL